MSAPDPVWLFHITHVEHLASIAREGLHCDAHAHQAGRLKVEIGNVGIKSDRHRRGVPVPPGGRVSDYVPFYFATRSPMLYSIHRGNVATYSGGQDGIVYLCTTLDEVERRGLRWVATDRNAALSTATHTNERADLDVLVDWPLMGTRIWRNTPADPERRARRQAELLIHRRLPWEAVMFIGTRTAEDLARVHRALDTVETAHRPRTDVRGGWYF